MEVYSKGTCTYNGKAFTGSLSDFKIKDATTVQKDRKQFFKQIRREVKQ